MELKAGDIVRYSEGVTALAKLISPHCGGWHAEHCLGGMMFVCDKPFRELRPATEGEIEEARTSQFYRL